MNEKRDLPLSLLKVFSLLIPRLTEAFRKTQLTPTDLFILSGIKYLGKTHNGQQIFLGKPMRDLLREFFRESPSQVTKRIVRLEERGFLTWIRLSADDKEALFGKRDGKKFALVLCDGGSNKIEEFNSEINTLFGSVTAGLRNPSTTSFPAEFQTMTEELVKHLSASYGATTLIQDGTD
jgi:DNA-binding MarR family transcriptional regulator